jgi:hypothetical protein
MDPSLTNIPGGGRTDAREAAASAARTTVLTAKHAKSAKNGTAEEQQPRRLKQRRK